jgi:FtsH-binding integral membrane protein
MLASIGLLVGIGEISAPTRRGEKIVVEIIAGLVIVIIVSRTIMRRKYVFRGAQPLAEDPTNVHALRRWQTGCILGVAQSEAIATFGLSLRFMGFTLREVAPFYAAGFVLMIFSGPRAPLENG